MKFILLFATFFSVQGLALEIQSFRNDSLQEWSGYGFKYSNEDTSELNTSLNKFEKLRTISAGSYLSVGGTRSFLHSKMVAEANHIKFDSLIVFDIDAEVLDFVENLAKTEPSLTKHFSILYTVQIDLNDESSWTVLHSILANSHLSLSVIDLSNVRQRIPNFLGLLPNYPRENTNLFLESLRTFTRNSMVIETHLFLHIGAYIGKLLWGYYPTIYSFKFFYADRKNTFFSPFAKVLETTFFKYGQK